MKIYFLQTYDRTYKDYQTGYPPLGIGYIAAYLRERIPDIDFIVRNQIDGEDVIREKPDILAITSVTQNFDITRELAAQVKQKLNIPIIVGGEHISCIPDNISEHMDVAVLREGEIGFYELVKLYMEHGQLKPKHLRNILGISYWEENGKVKVNEPRPAFTDLDQVPIPARDLFPPGPQLMFTARGCSYKCKFCSSAAFWETIRFFSPERVVEEMLSILELDPYTKNILIFDDLFAAKKARLAEIAQLMEDVGIPQRVSFWADSTANMIMDDVCQSLVKMNFYMVAFGFESGNNDMIQWLKGKWTSLDTNKRAIRLCQKYGLQVHGSFMMGLPDETEEQMRQTLHFIKTETFDKGGLAVCTPLPGTPFWKLALDRGLVQNHMPRWEALRLRQVDWFPDDEDFILMTNKVPRHIFREIFNEGRYELNKKQAIYEEKRAEYNVRRLKFSDFFAESNIARAMKDPKRAIRYAQRFVREKFTGNGQRKSAAPVEVGGCG